MHVDHAICVGHAVMPLLVECETNGIAKLRMNGSTEVTLHAFFAWIADRIEAITTAGVALVAEQVTIAFLVHGNASGADMHEFVVIHPGAKQLFAVFRCVVWVASYFVEEGFRYIAPEVEVGCRELEQNIVREVVLDGEGGLRSWRFWRSVGIPPEKDQTRVDRRTKGRHDWSDCGTRPTRLRQ